MEEIQIIEIVNKEQKTFIEQMEKDYFLIPRARRGGIIASIVGLLIMTGVISWQSAKQAVSLMPSKIAIEQITNYRETAEADAKAIAEMRAKNVSDVVKITSEYETATPPNAEDFKSLDISINQLIHAGFKPYGSPYITKDGHLAQGMIKF